MSKALFFIHPRHSLKEDLKTYGLDTDKFTEEELEIKVRNESPVITPFFDFSERERERENHG